MSNRLRQLALCTACLVFAAPALAQDTPAPVSPAPAPSPQAPQEAAPPQTPAPEAAPAPQETPAAEEPPTADDTAGMSDEELGLESEDPCAASGTGLCGVMTDAVNGETIIEGAITIIGRNRRIYTDYNGNYTINLPPGTYTIRAFYDLYQPSRIENIEVRQGERTRLDIQLAPDVEELEEVVVTARAETASEATQLSLRRQSTAVQDSISAQEIARSPDNNAGEAIRRVVGATVVGGQYLYVRGLGGRYTNVLLNGAALPSSDPDQPGVQLDLFPAGVLSALTVVKTFTPNLPGDAAGGTLDISTRQYPTRFTLGVSLSLGANTQTTFQEGPSGSTGSLDFLGFDDGSRSLPSAVPRDALVKPTTGILTEQQTYEIGRAFRPTFTITRGMALPNMRLNVNVGDTLSLGERRFGYLLTVGFSNATQRLAARPPGATGGEGEAVRRPFGVTNEPIQFNTRESVTNTAQWGALGVLSFELADQSDLTFTAFYTNVGETYAGVLSSYDPDLDADVRRTRSRFVSRSLIFGQVNGDHRGLPFDGRFRWQLSGSLGNRAEPDIRDLGYTANAGTTQFFWRPAPDSPQRLFLGLDQREVTASGDLTVPVATATLRLGGLFRYNERAFFLRRFYYEQIMGGFQNESGLLPPDELFSPSRIGTELRIAETTGGLDGYDASQTLSAAFIMLDWPVLDWLRVVGGIRGEGFRQVVLSRDPTTNPALRGPTGQTYRTDVDILGSAGLVFQLTPDMYVRANYGTTVARPQVRELAPFLFPDFVRLRNVTGNADLRRTRMDNIDLRWEWFPGSSEVIAATFFYKNFQDPIESVAQNNSTFTFKNARTGTNYGAELEARVSLGRIAPVLDFLQVGANLTFVFSEVVIAPEDLGQSTSPRRPLAGQSPYVANLSLSVAPPGSGFAVRLFYNVFGPRITDVGQGGIPDIYQQEFNSLDLAFTLDVADNYEIRGSIENLLYDDYVLVSGPNILQQYNQGISFSVGFGVKTN